MYHKKFLCVLLGLGIIFYSSSNLNGMSAGEAIYYTGLSALGFIGATHILYHYLDKHCPDHKRDCTTRVFKGFSCLVMLIIGYVLYKKTPDPLLKEAKELYKQAWAEDMFFVAKNYHSNYKGLMEKIDIQYREYETPLVYAYYNLGFIKYTLREAKYKFNDVKKLIDEGKVSQRYMKIYCIDIHEIEDYIEQIDVHLEYVIDSMVLIKKHPNYLKELNIEQQREIMAKQDEATKELRWMNFQKSVSRLS